MLAKTLEFTIVLAVVPVLVGCAAKHIGPERTITVRWQRLVDSAGRTCERCGDTQTALRLAAGTLKRCLRPLNIDVTLKEVPIDPKTCARDVSQSNRIFVKDRPLEDWLEAKVGMSPCASCCPELGENVRCRTVIVDGQTYEAITTALIVRAGLLAAEASLAQQSIPGARCPAAGQAGKALCCPGAGRMGKASCCPKSRPSTGKASGTSLR